MAELRRRAFYLVPEKKGNRVVQVVGMSDRTLVVMEPETRIRWTIRRAPFEQRVRDGRAPEVEPQWNPAGQTVEV